MDFILGTAQLGLDYGISNDAGKPVLETVEEVLSSAVNLGIKTFDTAPAYGDAEDLLGRFVSGEEAIRIVTKTAPHGRSEVCPDVVDSIRRSFELSLQRLRRDVVYGVLVHHAQDLLVNGGDAIWKLLSSLRDEGIAGRIGVSAYSPQQVATVLERYDIDLVQIPMNLLDRRFEQTGVLQDLNRKKVEIHTRSAHLQGLLLMEPETLHSYFRSVVPLLAHYHRVRQRAGLTVVEASLGYINSVPAVDGVVIGVTNAEQLLECERALRRPAGMDYTGYGCQDELIVEPYRWDLS